VIDRLRLARGRQFVVDLAMVSVFVGMLVNKLFIGLGTPADVAGDPRWVFPLFLVGDLALLWRRRLPAVAAVGFFAPFALHAFITSAGVEGAFALFPAMVVLYSLGAYAADRSLVAGILGVVALSAVHDTHDPQLHLSNSDEVWNYILWVSVQGLVLMAGVAVATRRKAMEASRRAERLEQERRDAVADERAKIARELHDVVTHNVNVVVMQAMAAHGVLSTDPDRARAPLEAIETSGREALAEMRRMLGVLREDEPMLAPQPGAGDVARLAHTLRATGQQIDCTLSGDLESLSPGLGMVVYRIVQEALTNAMKHAAGAQVQLGVTILDGCVEVRVHNDPGKGESAPTGAGQGLVGMSERAALFGGELHAGPSSDGGFLVVARLPVEAA
jgi:signal transduction histidine kinase